MPLKVGMGDFLKQVPIDILLLHLNVDHIIIAETWHLSFQKKSVLLNLGRCNWLLRCMKSRDGNA